VNALPQKLGIKGLSDQILPEAGLDNVLDKRVFGKKILPESALLPQHGTARGIVRYLELLHDNKLISEKISRQVLEVFDRNPKCFAPRATPNDCKSGGQGGSIVWIRPFFTPYNMVGWGILIRNQRVALAFCLWCEWLPEGMSDEDQWRWLSGLSDCIVNVLLLPAARDASDEDVSQPCRCSGPAENMGPQEDKDKAVLAGCMRVTHFSHAASADPDAPLSRLFPSRKAGLYLRPFVRAHFHSDPVPIDGQFVRRRIAAVYLLG
jgi:hypothetical protein